MMASWYIAYERLKGFSNFILSTTASISNNSTFSGWNDLEKEETFRKQYNRIFNGLYNPEFDSYKTKHT